MIDKPKLPEGANLTPDQKGVRGLVKKLWQRFSSRSKKEDQVDVIDDAATTDNTIPNLSYGRPPVSVPEAVGILDIHQIKDSGIIQKDNVSLSESGGKDFGRMGAIIKNDGGVFDQSGVYDRVEVLLPPESAHGLPESTANASVAGSSSLAEITRSLDHVPADISLSNTTVEENAVNGTVVATLTALGADPGEKFTYALVSQTVTNVFGIVGNKLIVKNSKQLNFKKHPTIDVKIRVTNSFGSHLGITKTITLTESLDRAEDK